MIQIGDKIVSRDLFENHFVCHLEHCEGNCCVFGDSGAPLEDDEVTDLEDHIGNIQPYLRAEGLRAIQDQGSWVVDNDGDRVTPLIGREECAYVVFEEGIARCAIELAHEKNAVPIQKPVSCHLYPIRVSNLKQGVALNYHQWSICEPARLLGKKEELPVFRFLKEALIRVYGKNFYDELELVYQELQKKVTETNR